VPMRLYEMFCVRCRTDERSEDTAPVSFANLRESISAEQGGNPRQEMCQSPTSGVAIFKPRALKLAHGRAGSPLSGAEDAKRIASRRVCPIPLPPLLCPRPDSLGWNVERSELRKQSSIPLQTIRVCKASEDIREESERDLTLLFINLFQS